MLFIRLIRWPNLFIIALTQFLVRYCLIMPAFAIQYKVNGEFPEHLSKIQFLLMVASTLLIAAGGYIINDINDTDIDAINKPGKNVISSGISENTAMRVYYGFSTIGVALGFIVAIEIGKFSFGFIPLFCTISLFMYATFYKKRFLSGNILIALLSALSVLLIGLYEPEYYKNIVYLFYYAVFAFETSLIREIIKDIEDLDGDERAQVKSLPVKLGIKKTKLVLYGIILFTAASVLHVLYHDFYQNKVISFWLLTGIFILPLIILAYWIYLAQDKKDYSYASTFSKAYMLLGICSMAGLWYYFLR